jgi:hypothetical protein
LKGETSIFAKMTARTVLLVSGKCLPDVRILRNFPNPANSGTSANSVSANALAF